MCLRVKDKRDVSRAVHYKDDRDQWSGKESILTHLSLVNTHLFLKKSGASEGREDEVKQ